MKRNNFLLSIFIALLITSCSIIGRTAAKYWTKKQITEFVSNCESQASRLLSTEKAVSFCDCAVDVVAVKYPDYQDVKKAPIKEILKVANDCRKN